MNESVSFSRVFSVVQLHIIEQLRSYQLLVMNIILPLLFFCISLFIKQRSNMSQDELSVMINSQFFSTALMLCVVTYCFSFPLVNLVDMKEKKTMLWIGQSKLGISEFIVGNKIANLFFLNFQSILIIILFSLLGYLDFFVIAKIVLIINLTFFVLNPFAFIFAKFMKSVSFASNFSSMIMLLLIFTLTFSTLFSIQLNFNLEKIQRFLVINPLFGYYNSMLVLVGRTTDYFFKSFFGTIAYLIIFGLITNLIEKKFFKYN